MGRPLAHAVLVLVSGCVFTRGVAHAPDDGPQDAPPDIATDVPSTCWDRWFSGTIRFDTPVTVAGVSSPTIDRDPFLSSDELTIWFSSDRAGSVATDIYTATRNSLGAAFATPTKFTAASTSAYDSKLSMTADGLLLVFASDQAGGRGGGDIWQATRASTASAFGAPDESGEVLLDDGANQYDAMITPDGLHLYYASGSSPQRITLSARGSTSTNFGTPTLVTELNTSGSNADPAVSSDERLIVFSSTRPAANAGANLWFATRGAANQAFGTPMAVADVSSDSNDADPFFSADGCRLYFSSDRSGNWELYVATAR